MLRSLQIGSYRLDNNLVLAPMAGVTDRPFRQLCKRMGAGMAVSEMVASNPDTRGSRKSDLRLDHAGEVAPVVVQILGNDPAQMADAARYNVAHSAQIIDINMGCPAKKVCKKAAGSALLADEALVHDILQAVVEAVDVPVTLKIRTGVDRDHRNGARIAGIAQDCGIRSLAVHGRTREDLYRGAAEYDTIAEIVRAVDIPVLANGDIDGPEKAARVLDKTGAAGIMIGRAAQGRPWIFREIAHYLATGEHLPPPAVEEVSQVMLAHLHELHAFYGEFMGVRIARKHVGWYLGTLPGGESARRKINQIQAPAAQITAVGDFFSSLQGQQGEHAA